MPVRRGRWVRKLYEHSLSLTFMILFVVSVALHAIGGAGDYNQEQLEHGLSGHVTAWQYLLTSSFWFQSLQNWQSPLHILHGYLLDMATREGFRRVHAG